MSAHTPGPWLFSHRKSKTGFYSTEVYTGDGEVVATVAWYPKAISSSTTGTYRDDNARLIAAAPELLYALEMMLDQFRYTSINNGDDAAIVFAKHAIAKAKGESV